MHACITFLSFILGAVFGIPVLIITLAFIETATFQSFVIPTLFGLALVVVVGSAMLGRWSFNQTSVVGRRVVSALCAPIGLLLAVVYGGMLTDTLDRGSMVGGALSLLMIAVSLMVAVGGVMMACANREELKALSV